MDYPSAVRRSQAVALVAALSSLIVGSDFALAPYVNVKLLDVVVFFAAFVFGFRLGAAVAVISETVWSVASPWGIAGAITPFLVAGELLFAAAGWWSSRLWGGRSQPISLNAVSIGAMMLLCAFVWDFETNAATAIIAYWPGLTLQNFFGTEVLGIPFALVHEGADFLLGAFLAPMVIVLGTKLPRWGG